MKQYNTWDELCKVNDADERIQIWNAILIAVDMNWHHIGIGHEKTINLMYKPSYEVCKKHMYKCMERFKFHFWEYILTKSGEIIIRGDICYKLYIQMTCFKESVWIPINFNPYQLNLGYYEIL